MSARRDDGLDAAVEQSRLAAALWSSLGDLERKAEPAALLQVFAEVLVESSPRFKLAWFYIGARRAREIRPQYRAGTERRYAERLRVDRSALMMRGPVRRALEGGEPVVQKIPATLGPMYSLLPGIREWHRAALRSGVRSVLALPFPLLCDEDWGLTVVYADHPEYFDATGLEPFRALYRLVQIGLDRIALRAAEQRSRADLYRARVQDRLTALPNQTGFDERWRVTAALPDRTALLVRLDIDDFGALNLAVGSAAGDTVLRTVADRLIEFAGVEGVVARVGADEFLLGTFIADPKAASAVVERCQAIIGRELLLGDRCLAVSVTAGYAVATAAEVPTAWQADLALRRARTEGAGARQGYERRIDRVGHAPQGLFGDLRRAMDDHQLALWYQPQVALDNPGVVVGAEALLRWRRDDDTMVTPDQFIPAVESSAMIRDIGIWVLGEAISALAGCGDNGLPTVGVNIGMRHLLHPRFLEDIDAVLPRAGEERRRLSVEITETAALTDIDATVRVIGELRRRGVSVALDDFGTGHASFSHLAELPVNQIKIDRQFVDGVNHHPRRLALVESLLMAARGLGLGVVAEGVETFAEGDMLAGLGCRVAQGYWYAQPMPAADFARWLGARQSVTAPDLPLDYPALSLVKRLTAALHSVERGDLTEPALIEVPPWFAALAVDDHRIGELMKPVFAYLEYCRKQGAHPPGGDGWRTHAIAALEDLARHLREHPDGHAASAPDLRASMRQG